jgi:hypothetical protein
MLQLKVLGVRIAELREKLTVLNRLRDDLEETSRIVSGCLACQNETSFPDGCAKCSVMTQHPALPRSVRVLWSVGQCTHEHARRAPVESPAEQKAE